MRRRRLRREVLGSGRGAVGRHPTDELRSFEGFSGQEHEAELGGQVSEDLHREAGGEQRRFRDSSVSVAKNKKTNSILDW